MAHLSLYRKYRSQTFGDLIGQDHVVKTLQSAIAQNRLAHSYLFTGPRGTGKTSTARLLSKALCCEKGPAAEPCNVCEICRSITEGTCIDVVEMDAASDSGVDDVRDRIVEVTEYQPMVARYKIFIIDEAHDLSSKAFDALLKTIEEPPPHIVFILATTEYSKVPPTIRSRCQKYEFHRATMADLVGRLNHVVAAEGYQAEPAAINAIARMADGGYRDALSLLEQAFITADGAITLQLVYDQLGLVAEETVDRILLSMHRTQIVELMATLEEVTRLGRDPRSLIESMVMRLSDLTRAVYEVDSGLDATRQASLHETAQLLGRDALLRLRSALAEAHRTIRDISLPRVWLEAELIRIATQVLAAPVAAPVASPRPAPAESASPSPSPVAAPKPTPANRDVPAGRAPAPVPSAPAGQWGAVVHDLNILSKTLGMKLQGTRVIDVQADKVTVELKSKIEYDWITEKPKVVAEIRKAVATHYGAGVEPVFTVVRREEADLMQSAVESPAEGARLEQLVRNVFGDIDGSPKKTSDPTPESEYPTEEGQQE